MLVAVKIRDQKMIRVHFRPGHPQAVIGLVDPVILRVQRRLRLLGSDPKQLVGRKGCREKEESHHLDLRKYVAPKTVRITPRSAARALQRPSRAVARSAFTSGTCHGTSSAATRCYPAPYFLIGPRRAAVVRGIPQEPLKARHSGRCQPRGHLDQSIL